MGRGEKERKTMIFLRNWWKTEKNDDPDRSEGSKRLQKASRPAGNPEEGHLPPSQGGSDCSERGKTFQKLWKTMIFLRIWWKMKKNYDFLGSGPIRRLQKASRPASRVGDWGPPPSQGGSDLSKVMKMMIFWWYLEGLWEVLTRNPQKATRTEANPLDLRHLPRPSAQDPPKGVSRSLQKPLKYHENHQNIMKFHQILLVFSSKYHVFAYFLRGFEQVWTSSGANPLEIQVLPIREAS